MAMFAPIAAEGGAAAAGGAGAGGAAGASGASSGGLTRMLSGLQFGKLFGGGGGGGSKSPDASDSNVLSSNPDWEKS